MHYCYIIYDRLSNKTYVGYTTEPNKRIRQHNGLIKGGAKYTTRNSTSQWEYLVIIASPEFTHQTALSFEWYVKHNKHTGVNGRIKSLIQTIMNNRKFQDCSFYLYISPLMYERITIVLYLSDLFDELMSSTSGCLLSTSIQNFIDDTYDR